MNSLLDSTAKPLPARRVASKTAPRTGSAVGTIMRALGYSGSTASRTAVRVMGFGFWAMLPARTTVGSSSGEKSSLRAARADIPSSRPLSISISTATLSPRSAASNTSGAMDEKAKPSPSA